MWRRIRPISLMAFAFALSLPWTFKFYKAFALAPSSWLTYGAAVAVGAVWLGVVYWMDFQTARGRTPSIALIGVCVVVALVGFVTMYTSDTIYTHARFALQRGAMERFVEGDGPCPSFTRCIRDGVGLVGFVWGSHDQTWGGVCYDSEGVMVRAEALAYDDRFAGRPRAPRVFNAMVTVARPLAPGWLRCSVTRLRLGEVR